MILAKLRYVYQAKCFFIRNRDDLQHQETWTHSSIRRARSALMVFKTMQLLMGHFQDIFSRIIIPVYMYWLILGLHVQSIYFVVQFHAQVHLQYLAVFVCCAIMCTIYAFVTFPMAAKMYTNCERWRKRPLQGEDKWLRAERRALPSLKLWVGKSFFVQRHTVLTFMSLVITMTANLLVCT